MARLRSTLITMATLIVLAAFTLSTLAQQPPAGGGAQPPGGGRGGPVGGGRGPGGFGGFGGGFNSLFGLASNAGVQSELKVTDKQKAAIKSLSDKLDQRTREVRTEMGFGGPPGGPPGGGNGQGGGRQGGQGGNGNAQGGGGAIAADGGGNGGQGGGVQGGGRGNRFNMEPETAERRAQMREMTTQLRLSAEQSLGKILDKGQAVRLKQIQLQLEGPFLVLRDDMVEKLNLSEEQVQMLTEIRDGQRQKSREVQRSGRGAWQAAMQKLNPDQGNNGGGNAGNGGNGGNGNRGNRPRFDPEVFRKVMETPEVKDQMEKTREQEKQIEDESYAIVMKNLYPRQRATLKNMVGAPFDRSLLGGPFGRPPGAPIAKNGTANGKAAGAKSNSEADGEESASSTTTKPQAPAKAKPSTTARKKSLRELRGGSSDDEGVSHSSFS